MQKCLELIGVSLSNWLKKQKTRSKVIGLFKTFLLLSLFFFSHFCQAMPSSRIEMGPIQSQHELKQTKKRLNAYFSSLDISIEAHSKNEYYIYINGLESDPAAFAMSTELNYLGFDNRVIIATTDNTKVFVDRNKDEKSSESLGYYQFAKSPNLAKAEVEKGFSALQKGITHPLYAYKNTIDMPLSPEAVNDKTIHLSLKEAIYLALRYNPNIQNSVLNRISQRFAISIAEQKFALNYALSGQYNWVTQKDSLGNTITSSNTVLAPKVTTTNQIGTVLSSSIIDNVSNNGANNPRWNINVEQPLLRGAGHQVALRSLRDTFDNEIGQKIALKNQVVSQVTSVISAYRSLISQNNALLTAKRSLQDAKNTYKINEKKIKAGQVERTANIQQAYQVENLKLSLSQAELGFIKAKKALLAQLGLSPKVNFEVPSDIYLEKLYVPKLQLAIKTALLNNAEYQTLLIQSRIHKRAKEVAENNQLWQLNLTADFSTGSGVGPNNGNSGFKSLSNFENWTSNVGLNLSVPINDLSRKGELINAKLLLEQDKINLLAAKRALQTSVANQIEEIKSNVLQYKLSQKQLALAKRSYDLELKKQQAGISSSIDLTNTQNQLISANNNLISVKIGYLNAITTLEQMLGSTLSVWGIQLIY